MSRHTLSFRRRYQTPPNSAHIAHMSGGCSWAPVLCARVLQMVGKIISNGNGKQSKLWLITRRQCSGGPVKTRNSVDTGAACRDFHIWIAVLAVPVARVVNPNPCYTLGATNRHFNCLFWLLLSWSWVWEFLCFIVAVNAVMVTGILPVTGSYFRLHNSHFPNFPFSQPISLSLHVCHEDYASNHSIQRVYLSRIFYFSVLVWIRLPYIVPLGTATIM